MDGSGRQRPSGPVLLRAPGNRALTLLVGAPPARRRAAIQASVRPAENAAGQRLGVASRAGRLTREYAVPSLPIDDENLPLFTVGQVAATLEVQHAFLRRLDEFNVVRPSRSAGGQRRYTRHEVTRVAYVLRLVEDGLTLAAVRRVLQLEAQVRQLEARVRELESERDALAVAVAGRDAPAARPRPFGKINEPEGPGQPA
jgi:MerR family transcriptional regulator, heat shock protein HspR